MGFTICGITFEFGRNRRQTTPISGPLERQEFYLAKHMARHPGDRLARLTRVYLDVEFRPCWGAPYVSLFRVLRVVCTGKDVS